MVYSKHSSKYVGKQAIFYFFSYPYEYLSFVHGILKCMKKKQFEFPWYSIEIFCQVSTYFCPTWQKKVYAYFPFFTLIFHFIEKWKSEAGFTILTVSGCQQILSNVIFQTWELIKKMTVLGHNSLFTIKHASVVFCLNSFLFI